MGSWGDGEACFPEIKAFCLSRKWTVIVLSVLYLFIAGIRIYWISQKTTLHMDEVASVRLTCYNEWDYENNRGYTGKEAKEIGMSCRNNPLSDIYHLWQDNRDSTHTNLYYSLFRIPLIGLDSVDIKKIVIRGGILNLLFFTISFIVFFLLTRLLFPKAPLLQLTATACTFLSTATISTTLFLRPYQLQQTSFIVFCYYFFKTFDLEKHIIHNDTAYINVKLLILSSLTTAFAILTGYFALFFVGLFGLYAIYHKIKTTHRIDILFYAASLCVSVLFAQTFYLKYLNAYFSNSISDDIHFQISLENIKNSLLIDKIFALNYFFTYPVIAICALCLLFVIIQHRKNFFTQKDALYIFAASVIYAITIMNLAPWKDLRYIAPIFPFFMMLPAAIIYSIRERKISIIVMLLLFIFFSQSALKENKIKYLHNEDVFIFRNDPTVPVFIFNKTQWKYAELVYWFNDKQIYYFNASDNTIRRNKEAYLIIENTPEMLSTLRIPPQTQIEKRFLSFFFAGCKVRPNEQE